MGRHWTRVSGSEDKSDGAQNVPHQCSGKAPKNQSKPATTGVPIRIVSTKPLIRSTTQSVDELLLKPYFSSSRNCEAQSQGIEGNDNIKPIRTSLSASRIALMEKSMQQTDGAALSLATKKSPLASLSKQRRG